MSLKVVRRILENPGCIEAPAWNLLIAMASFGHDDGTSIYASMETLANTCGIDRATGWRALPKLLKSGLVIDTGGKHKSEHGSPTTIWRINLSKLPFKASQDATLSLQDDAPIVSQDSPKCRKQAPKASQDATRTEVRRPGYNPGIPTVVENNRITTTTDSLDSVVVAESIPDGKPKREKPVQPVKPVQPASPSPVGPVYPSGEQGRRPDAPPNPPTPPKLWEIPTGEVGGVPESRIQFCVWFQIVKNGDTKTGEYYRKQLSGGFLTRVAAVQKLDRDTPPGDVIPRPKPKPEFPAANCPDCHGRGQLPVKHVEGSLNTYVPLCWCSREGDGPYMLAAKPDCPECDGRTGEVSRKESKLMNGSVRTDITWCDCLRRPAA